MQDLRESLDLYDDMNCYISHHLHSLAADVNVSDIELTAEASKMAGILSLYAVQILLIRDDPIMMPVYAFMCEDLYNAIASYMQNDIDKKEAQK